MIYYKWKECWRLSMATKNQMWKWYFWGLETDEQGDKGFILQK